MHLQTIACNQFSRNFYTNSIYFIFYIRYAAVAVAVAVVVHYIIVRLFNKVKTSLEFFSLFANASERKILFGI